MKRLRIKESVIITGLLLMLSFCMLNAEVNPNPSWTVDDPVVMAKECLPYDFYAAKDPTIVYYGGKYLVYYTGANQSGGWQMCFTSAATIPELKTAKRTYMSSINQSYFCAPELFFFEPQNLWYLIYQGGPYDASYSTTTDPTNPTSWSKPKDMGLKGAANMGWDYYVICDDQYAYLFNTPSAANARKVYVRRTKLANFPTGWEASKVAASDVFEATMIYKCIADGQYYLLIEALLDGRSYSLFKSSTIDGPYNLVIAKWGTKANLKTYRGAKWTTNVSHGELIRTGYNQKLEIADINKVDFLIQGALDISGDYQKIRWDLGLIRNYEGAFVPPVPPISTIGTKQQSRLTPVSSTPRLFVQPLAADGNANIFNIRGQKMVAVEKAGKVDFTNNAFIKVTPHK